MKHIQNSVRLQNSILLEPLCARCPTWKQLIVQNLFSFFSQIGVFLARLFSIGPQKTILRLLRGAVITDCCCENPEKTDSESGNWKKDVFNYRKQWKQFPTWQTTSDFADSTFPPSLAKYLYWRDLFTLKSSASQMSWTFISTPDILTERTKTLGCFVKLKYAVSIIVDCCRSLSRRKGWFRSHQWRAALKQPPIFLPAIIIIIERCNTPATGYINQ